MKQTSNMRSSCVSANLDGLKKTSKKPDFFDLSLSRYVVKHKKSSTLFSKERISLDFLTEDSRRYYTPVHAEKKLDSVKNGRAFHCREIHPKMSLWSASIVGAIIFGMFSMTMIHRYLGQSVSAKIQESMEQTQYADNFERESPDEINEEIDVGFITQVLSRYPNNQRDDRGEKLQFEKEIRQMVKGHPIEKMASHIAQQDKIVAAFLVSIAKKESNWGKRVPVLDGRDCYNYWGYRGIRDKMGSGGHTCFDSPSDAVETVSKRIKFLVSNENLDTPGEMVVWKCGYDCSWDNPESVKKWIRDVGMYFDKLNEK